MTNRPVCCMAATITLLIVVGAGCSRIARAQDSHYNTNLYGDRSTLLGGSVIASVDDASAAYYNPGALADIAAKDVFLGTKVFDATRIALVRSGEENFKIDTEDIGKAPSFIGGMIPIRSNTHRFAYTFLKRASFSLRMTETVVDATTSSSNRSDIVSNRLSLDFDSSLNEDWLGLSWAYAPTSRTRIGISNFFSYRSHQSSTLRSTEAYTSDGRLTTGTATRVYRYSYLSVLWKLGIKQHVNERLTMGLSLTTPAVGLGIFSDGSAGASASVAGSAEDDDGTPQDFFVATYQKSIESSYKSPVSIGVGGAYQYPDRTIHVSAEWFGSVATYDVLDLDPFIGQSTGDTLDLQVVGGASGVFNLGVGLEQRLTDKTDLFFGFHTDFSSARRDVDGSIYATEWNLYHLSGGSQFLLGDAQITLGVGYAFGAQKLNRLLPGDEVGPLQSTIPTDFETQLQFHRLKFIIGFGVRT